MNEKWFDECSVVAYPHEIIFLHIDGGSINYCVDRHVSEYVGKIQTQLNTLQNENRDKDIKIMILQSKIDKAIELCETEKKYTYDNVRRDEKTGKLIYGNKIELDVVNKSKILDILKEDK